MVVKLQYLRHSLFKHIVSTISWFLVFLIKDPGSALVKTLQLLVLGVLQHLRHMPQNTVHLKQRSKARFREKQHVLSG